MSQTSTVEFKKSICAEGNDGVLKLGSSSQTKVDTSKAKEAGSSIIAEARQMDLKQRQQRLKLDQEEGSIAQARKVKAHADEAASAAKKKVADEQQMQEKNEDAISNLKMVAQQDKLALATAISKKQALGAVFKREGDAEAALQVEMAALKRATNREEAMEKAFEATEGKAKEMKAQVGVDSSFVKRAYAAQSKLASNESHEKLPQAHRLRTRFVQAAI